MTWSPSQNMVNWTDYLLTKLILKFASNFTLSNFTSFNLTLPAPNFTLPALNITLPNITLPNVTLPNVTLPNVTLPNVTLPNVTLPNVTLPTFGSIAGFAKTYEFPILITLCFLGWYRSRRWLIANEVTPDNRGYLISTAHALAIIPLHAWMVMQPLFAESRESIYIYNLAYAATISYFLLDLQHLFAYCREKGYFYSIVFHHVLGVAATGLCYYITNFGTAGRNMNWDISLAFLSEISTPLLNWIQYHHGQVSDFTKCFFMWLYFWCRPFVFTYLSIVGTREYGSQSVFTLSCYSFTLLNYYWFYKIYQKSLEKIRVIDLICQNNKDDLSSSLYSEMSDSRELIPAPAPTPTPTPTPTLTPTPIVKPPTSKVTQTLPKSDSNQSHDLDLMEWSE